MKQFYKIVILLCVACNFLTFSLIAQQFKWVRGGGSTEDLSSYGGTNWEQTKYMSTDPNGNMYAVSIVGNAAMSSDTFSRTGAYGTNLNILVTSYNCNGQMRWAKLLGSSSDDSYVFGIAVDGLGHVYVSGAFGAGGGIFHIGYDTTISMPASHFLSTGLIQFDTLGHYKWMRYVGANTSSSWLALASQEDPITVDAANNVHYFCYMGAGVPLLTGTTTQRGVYDLTYSASGTFLSDTRLALDSAWFLWGAVIDPVSNKLYACGEINQSIYGGFATDSFFAAAFTPSRSLLWQYYCGHGDDDGLSGVVMDKSRHLYFSGGSQSGVFLFHGDSVHETAGNEMATVMKTDTNGNVKWIKHFDDAITSVNYFNSIALMPNYRIVAAGTFAGTTTDGTSSLSTPTGEGYSPFFAIIDSGENLQTIKQIHGDGFYNFGNAVTTDTVGNIYIGGAVADSIWAGFPHIPAYHTVGGNSDFFVMKFGVDCSCTWSPVASATVTGNHTINGSYTGTTTGLDSVVWSYGDGTIGTGITTTHTYADTGEFHVCATVYTTCGSDISCSIVRYEPTLGTGVISISGIKVFPNPANDELNITDVMATTEYRLLNVTGICLGKGILRQGKNTVSLQNFTQGVYVLEMTGDSGERNIVRVVKE